MLDVMLAALWWAKVIEWLVWGLVAVAVVVFGVGMWWLWRR